MARDRGLKGATLHGIPGQGSEVYRLRRRLRVHSWRTAVLPRQTVQERTQTLQSLQGQAGVHGGSHAGRATIQRWKPGPIVRAAARKPPSRSSPRKAVPSSVGSASSSGALRLPLPDLPNPSHSIAPATTCRGCLVEVCVYGILRTRECVRGIFGIGISKERCLSWSSPHHAPPRCHPDRSARLAFPIRLICGSGERGAEGSAVPNFSDVYKDGHTQQQKHTCVQGRPCPDTEFANSTWPCRWLPSWRCPNGKLSWHSRSLPAFCGPDG